MVSTAIARKKYNIVLALTFDYGQRAAKREISAARKFCRLWKIEQKVIRLPWLAAITNTALVNRSAKLPQFCHPCERRDLVSSRVSRLRGDDMTAGAVWVPNRNALFINIAASFAESMGAAIIIAGFNKEEGATFPDNSLRFVRSMNETMRFGTMKRPRVMSMVQNMDKIEIMRYALDQRLPVWNCWPCYSGGKRLCGRCESCSRFLTALENS